MENEKEVARILKESLTIVDKLAKIDIDDVITNTDEYDILDELIKKAIKLTKNKLFKLK